MIYDGRDRLVIDTKAVLSGQRSSGYLPNTSFFNRAVLTGIYTADVVLTQADMQQRVNDFGAQASPPSHGSKHIPEALFMVMITNRFRKRRIR